jgi:general secretion pathway protein D
MATAEFVDSPITDVLRVVSDLTGWTILASPAVSAAPPRVNLWVKDMAPAEVLTQVAELSGLVLHRQGRAWQVMTFEEYAQRFGVQRQVRDLRHVEAARVVEVLRPFLAGADAARVVASAAGNQVVMLVPPTLQPDLDRLIDAIDLPAARDHTAVLRLEHLDASAIGPKLEAFLAGSTSNGGRAAVIPRPTAVEVSAGEPPRNREPGEGAAARAGQALQVKFMIEPRLNAVILRGVAADVQRAAALLRELDVAPRTRVVSYELRHTDAGSAFATLERLAGRGVSDGVGSAAEPRVSTARPRLKLALSQQNNRVIVEGSPADHERLARLIASVDQPLPPGAGEMRVYRLENGTADEVVQVMRDLIEPEGDGPVARTAPNDTRPIGFTPAPPEAASIAAASPVGTPEPAPGRDRAAPRFTAAPEINAVVVRASAAEHDVFAAVIADLDRPRDQVMIEVTLVSVASDEQFRLGLELGGSAFGTIGTLGFTSFGIGVVDAVTGNVAIDPAAPFGLNLSIFNGDDLSLVLNALRSVGKTRISSAPRLLVADNSPGEIRQIDEEPFLVASQSDSSTLTSFGGFVEAGTSVSVVPYISRGDWLRLDYEIELSSFRARTAEQQQANIPPPRTVSTTSGTVRVPAGHVVALGGLVSRLDQETLDAVPLLADLPLIGELFKNRGTDRTQTTLYIFIRPVILRDPAFRDLRLLSRDDARAAEVGDGRYPSNPLKLLLPPAAATEAIDGPPSRSTDPRSAEGGGP